MDEDSAGWNVDADVRFVVASSGTLGFLRRRETPLVLICPSLVILDSLLF